MRGATAIAGLTAAGVGRGGVAADGAVTCDGATELAEAALAMIGAGGVGIGGAGAADATAVAGVVGGFASSE